MYNFLALITMLTSCYFLLRVLRPAGIAESIIYFFTLFTTHIITIGYMLSFINHISDLSYWSILGLIAALISTIIFVWNRDTDDFILTIFRYDSLMQLIPSFKHWYTKDLSRFEKLVLSPLILTTLLLGILNATVVVFTAPHNVDGLSFYLPRVAYYLQHNNMNYFDANYWAQVLHPKNSTVLLLYTYLISGRNENLFQLIQFISYWVTICTIYAIAKKVGNSNAHSIFVAIVSALLIELLMQSTTTQNDLIITAYFGVTVFSLFAFRETHKWKYLCIAALGIGLAITTKASSLLALPSVALVASYIFFKSSTNLQSRLHHLSIFAGFTLLSFFIFAIPAGYLENYRNFGHPIGPPDVRILHSFEGKSSEYIAINGTKNLIRFGFEFLSIDGMRPSNIVSKVQFLIRAAPEKIVRLLGIDLETSEATRDRFILQKLPVAHEDLSYWGIFGFGLVWSAVLLSLIGVIKSTDIRVLSLAAVVFLISEAYAGPYDPWRGRHFTMLAVFVMPIVGVVLQTTNQFVKTYLLLIVLVGCISAISAVVLRESSTLISISYQDENKHRSSIFRILNRMEQLTRSRSDYHKSLTMFDQVVPINATVAVALYEDVPEYPLFGEYLTRTIIPINSFAKGVQHIPSSAEYLLYDMPILYPCVFPDDVVLDAWLLRRLTDDNRICP